MFFWLTILTVTVMAMIHSQRCGERDKRYIYIIFLFIFAFLSGTRYYMGGSDYKIYQLIYYEVPFLADFSFDNIKSDYILSRYEWGYVFINSFVKTLGLSFFGFTLVHSLFMFNCLYFGLKRYIRFPFILLFFFLYKLYFYNCFISMRQSITLAVFFICWPLLQDRKYVKYFSLVLITTLIHNGAFVLLPLYFISYIRLTKKRILLANVICLPFLIIPSSLFSGPLEKLLSYLPLSAGQEKVEGLVKSLDSGESVNIMHTLEYLLIMGLIIYFYQKIIKIDENAKFILKLFMLLLPFFTILRDMEILTRLKDYFTMSYPIIFGYLCMIDRGRYANVVKWFVVSLCLFGFLRFATLFNDGEMLGYKSYIFENESIWRGNE